MTPDMWSSVEKIEYDFMSITGTLWMPEGECADMNGCIEFFKRIDKNVELTKTISGGEPDTAYVRQPNGTWDAV